MPTHYTPWSWCSHFAGAVCGEREAGSEAWVEDKRNTTNPTFPHKSPHLISGSAVLMYFLWSIYFRNLQSRPHSWSWRVREAPPNCVVLGCLLLVGFWGFGAPVVSLQVFIFFILLFKCSYNKLTAVFLHQSLSFGSSFSYANISHHVPNWLNWEKFTKRAFL
jgi:hypothetical protein